MHFRKNKILITLFVASLSLECLAQKIESASIWIISFERRINGKDMGVYYWFTYELSDTCILYPLSLPIEDVDRRTGKFWADCLSDVNGYPFSEQVQFFSDTSAVFSVLKITANRKSLIQKNTHKWRDNRIGHGIEDLSRKKEKIFVYATPVTGIFELGERIHVSGNGETFTTPSMVPVSNLSYDGQLWEHDHLIRYYNFSYINFASLSSPSSSGDNVNIAIAETTYSQALTHNSHIKKE